MSMVINPHAIPCRSGYKKHRKGERLILIADSVHFKVGLLHYTPVREMARRRPILPVAFENDQPRSQRSSRPRDPDSTVSSSTYQEKYRTCKRKIKELEQVKPLIKSCLNSTQGTEIARMRLQQAKREVVSLQRASS